MSRLSHNVTRALDTLRIVRHGIRVWRHNRRARKLRAHPPDLAAAFTRGVRAAEQDLEVMRAHVNRSEQATADGIGRVAAAPHQEDPDASQ